MPHLHESIKYKIPQVQDDERHSVVFQERPRREMAPIDESMNDDSDFGVDDITKVKSLRSVWSTEERQVVDELFDQYSSADRSHGFMPEMYEQYCASCTKRRLLRSNYSAFKAFVLKHKMSTV